MAVKFKSIEVKNKMEGKLQTKSVFRSPLWFISMSAEIYWINWSIYNPIIKAENIITEPSCHAHSTSYSSSYRNTTNACSSASAAASSSPPPTTPQSQSAHPPMPQSQIDRCPWCWSRICSFWASTSCSRSWAAPSSAAASCGCPTQTILLRGLRSSFWGITIAWIYFCEWCWKLALLLLGCSYLWGVRWSYWNARVCA